MADLVRIPERSEKDFVGGIVHPELWLWDSWVMHDEPHLHLYCLALSRTTIGGAPIRPSERNNFQFHVRHFMSADFGSSWQDMGSVIEPTGLSVLQQEYRNIWSGSATRLDQSSYLFAYTGILAASPDRPFTQSIHTVISDDPNRHVVGTEEPLLCSLRDYDMLTEAGYYLGPRQQLGSQDGEEGGPILAFRDPFTFIAQDGKVHLFVSAKTSPKVPAIGHFILDIRGKDVEVVETRLPISLPDSDQFTQAEVPKVYFDPSTKNYLLLISACNRLYEGQPDQEVTKEHRLYSSASINGPWRSYAKEKSVLPGLGNIFGASCIDVSLSEGRMSFVPPITEMAPVGKQLTFDPVRTVNVFSGRLEPNLHYA